MGTRTTTTTEGKRISFMIGDNNYYMPDGDKSIVFDGLFKDHKFCVCYTKIVRDSGYRDEIKVIIENVEPPIRDITIDDDGKVTSILYGSDYFIGKGEKFCQLVLSEVPKIAFYRVESIKDIDDIDRGGGFGSSGLK
jgi:dUTPase